MPTSYVRKLAEEHNMSLDEAEKKWEQAKKKASEEGTSHEYFAYVTSIFKNMMHEPDGNAHEGKASGGRGHAAHAASRASGSGSHGPHGSSGSKSSGGKSRSKATA